MKPQIETKDDKVVITINQLDISRLRDIANLYCMIGTDVSTQIFAMQLKDELNESIEIACSQRMEKSS